LLTQAGIDFTVRAREVDEIPRPGEAPLALVRRLAQEKAEAAWEGLDEIVLAADTVVVVDDMILGKPRDAADAAEMLRRLSGRQHMVITGICLRHPAGSIVDCESTTVCFVSMTPEEIAAYVASGEPMDKAGGYAIQGLASKFVERIDGDYSNVVGLPLALVYRRLKEL
jgi:septum formation protein